MRPALLPARTSDLASRIWTHAAGGRWHRLDPDAPEAGEVAEFRFSRQCWTRARRVTITRRRDTETPQGHLWDAAGYNDAAYVTDLAGPPADLGACYDKRAGMEKRMILRSPPLASRSHRSSRPSRLRYARTIVVRRLGSLSGSHMETVRHAVTLARQLD